jgi:hypothetical protein
MTDAAADAVTIAEMINAAAVAVVVLHHIRTMNWNR